MTKKEAEKFFEDAFFSLKESMNLLESPRITIMVGLPRSGKSSFLESNFRRNYPKISADQLRLLIYGQKFWGEGEDLVWSLRKIFLKALLEQNLNIAVDETNTTFGRRKKIIDLAREYNYYVEIIHINTPKEKCIRRAEEEGYLDLIPIIEKMAENFEEIQPEEYDFIKVINLE